MTEQEAKALVEWFKARKGKTLKLNDNGIDCVVEALEKQIPKKPLPIITDDNEYICSICPICQQRAVEVTDLYCMVCGQKLDWGNEDAE
jgi:hypothetical protein